MYAIASRYNDNEALANLDPSMVWEAASGDEYLDRAKVILDRTYASSRTSTCQAFKWILRLANGRPLRRLYYWRMNHNTTIDAPPSTIPAPSVLPPQAFNRLASHCQTHIIVNNNPEELSALTALAAAADFIMDPISHSSIIPGFGLPGSLKSLDAPPASLISAALTTGANSSRSPSPAMKIMKSDSEASNAEDELRPTITERGWYMTLPSCHMRSYSRVLN